MSHRHTRPGLAVLAFLLALILAPYILAALAVVAVIWLVAVVVAFAFKL